MFTFVAKLLRLGEGKKLKVLEARAEEVNVWEPEFEALTDDRLKAKTGEFKARLADGEPLDDILPEAFAAVREASRRTLGMRHFDVQIVGGIALHQGKIAEMKTGEGKTLVATLAVYLNALTGQGVHIVTVNDYLARRDAEWMGPIYRFLGLNVGVIQAQMEPALRRVAYEADVTYGTNSEFGFDYLRDNMASRPEQRVQRGHDFGIVDEVDSILIDEARTPLIISGPTDQAADIYYAFARIVPTLKEGVDYEADEKMHTVAPTESGVAKVEKALGIDNLYGDVNSQLVNHLIQGLRAQRLYKKDVEYIVKDGEVVIVDEFTGRLMAGRRYSEGLHQAIEAKEKVKIREENQTLATITLQNYFRMYEKLAGMTGTAATEADEFFHIYKLDTVVIPPNRDMVRDDRDDLIYKSEDAKFKAVISDIVERHNRGQPVLVGTISIEKSERLSKALKRRGIAYEVLNAKNHEREAEIIAQAGRPGAVTVATNMAGRGVDIILGGNPADAELQKQVLEAGGLHVLGTERHESRRIDNQLRGRSGRQGDPGSSQFYLSLEDDLMRIFASERLGSIMSRLGLPEDQPINHSLITRTIETAQKQVESQNFEARKSVLKYDDVMNTQREVIYEQRGKALNGEDLSEQATELVEEVQRGVVAASCADENPDTWDLDTMLVTLRNLYPTQLRTEDIDLETIVESELEETVVEEALGLYKRREEEFTPEVMRQLERELLLHIIDNHWRDHLYEMDYLREGIGLRAVGQRDPLVEYKGEAYNLFTAMIEGIKEDFVRYVYRIQAVPETQEQEREHVLVAGGSDPGEGRQRSPQRVEEKVGRNDPCPCGSGKKFKKCHGR